MNDVSCRIFNPEKKKRGRSKEKKNVYELKMEE